MRTCPYCNVVRPESDFPLARKGRRKKCKDCTRKYHRTWHATKKQTGQALVGDAPGTCDVCHRAFVVGVRVATACFDHNHGTGDFRGWLCFNCNVALGHAGDNPEVLRALAEYLEARGATPTRILETV